MNSPWDHNATWVHFVELCVCWFNLFKWSKLSTSLFTFDYESLVILMSTYENDATFDDDLWRFNWILKHKFKQECQAVKRYTRKLFPPNRRDKLGFDNLYPLMMESNLKIYQALYPRRFKEVLMWLVYSEKSWIFKVWKRGNGKA